MTALAVHASHTAHVPHLSWPRVGAWSGSISLHLLILAVLLIPPVAIELARRTETPDPVAHIINKVEPIAEPAMPTVVQHKRVPVQPIMRPVAPPVSEIKTTMPIATTVDTTPPLIETKSTTPDSEPSAITYGHQTRVAYPRESLINHEQGTVILKVMVSAEGLVQAVEIEKTSGYLRLDRAARDAVKSWSFHPALRNGVAQSAWALVPVTFNLQQL